MSLKNKVAELVVTSDDADNLVKDIIYNNKPEVYKPSTFPIPIEGMEDAKGMIKFSYCDEGRLNYRLNIEGTRNSVVDSITVKGHIYSPLVDHCQDGLVTLQNRSLEYGEELNQLLDNIRSSFNTDAIDSTYFLAINYLENEVKIRAKSSGYRYIDFIRENHISKYSFWNGRIVLFKEYDGFNRDVVRLEKDTSSYSTGYVMGIIYLENGDLILSGDVDFYGIIILQNGALLKEGEEESLIKGKVIVNGFNQPDEGIKIQYDPEYTRLMARFLPGFISPTIDSIR
jgi:hypothetical protein